jgi:hypothetical protein
MGYIVEEKDAGMISTSGARSSQLALLTVMYSGSELAPTDEEGAVAIVEGGEVRIMMAM